LHGEEALECIAAGAEAPPDADQPILELADGGPDCGVDVLRLSFAHVGFPDPRIGDAHIRSTGSTSTATRVVRCGSNSGSVRADRRRARAMCPRWERSRMRYRNRPANREMGAMVGPESLTP